MALPRVKITFANGALGTIAQSADGVVGLLCTAEAVGDTFALQKAYTLRNLDALADLGITAETTGLNAFLHKQVKEFFAEAGNGAELWLMGFPQTVTQSEMVDSTLATGKTLIQAAQGRIRALAVAYKPADGYKPVITNGLDSDLTTAMLNAQALGVWATETLFAPLFVLLEAREYNGNTVDLADLATYQYNRVGVLLGDTASDTKGAAVGLLLGRIAKIAVQRHIGAVADGAVQALDTYIGDQKTAEADYESINDKGYITFRIFTGKSGSFFADANLATKATDDYRLIPRRRIIDKAYRIAYVTLIDYLNQEVPITADGTMVASYAKSWETAVESAIISGMGAEGNLGTDPADENDTGVQCTIDLTQNIVATGKVLISLKVKPYAYAQYIDVDLGFITIQ
jgi:hypothetical protein